MNLAFNASNGAVAKKRWAVATEAELVVLGGVKQKLAALAKRLKAFMECKGLDCWNPVR